MKRGHIKDLTPDPANARRHTPRNVGTIADALREVGAARSIVIDEDGLILAGNATVEAAAEAGITRLRVVDADGEEIVAVRRSGLTAQQKARLALYDNRAGELAEWDESALKALQDADVDLSGLWNDRELAELLAKVTEPSEGRTDPDDVPEERATDIKPGDLFELGRHRLLCGDSTKAEDVARVMGGEKADCWLVDPPYCSGGFQESGRAAGSVGTDGRRIKQRPVANDRLSTRGYIALMKSALSIADAALVYIFTDWRMWVNLFDVCESSGYGVRNMIVWDKGTPGMGVGWRTQHELVLFGCRATVGFDNHKAQGNVIACQRTGNVHHATEKPVELIRKILAVTDMAETVLDGFAGSGTTLIACEQEGRLFRGIELEPRCAQVAIDRWEAFTGSKAVKVADRPALTKRRKRA